MNARRVKAASKPTSYAHNLEIRDQFDPWQKPTMREKASRLRDYMRERRDVSAFYAPRDEERAKMATARIGAEATKVQSTKEATSAKKRTAPAPRSVAGSKQIETKRVVEKQRRAKKEKIRKDKQTAASSKASTSSSTQAPEQPSKPPSPSPSVSSQDAGISTSPSSVASAASPTWSRGGSVTPELQNDPLNDSGLSIPRRAQLLLQIEVQKLQQRGEIVPSTTTGRFSLISDDPTITHEINRLRSLVDRFSSITEFEKIPHLSSIDLEWRNKMIFEGPEETLKAIRDGHWVMNQLLEREGLLNDLGKGCNRPEMLVSTDECKRAGMRYAAMTIAVLEGFEYKRRGMAGPSGNMILKGIRETGVWERYMARGGK